MIKTFLILIMSGQIFAHSEMHSIENRINGKLRSFYPSAKKIEMSQLKWSEQVPGPFTDIFFMQSPPLGLSTFYLENKKGQKAFGRVNVRVKMPVVTLVQAKQAGTFFTEKELQIEERELMPLLREGFFTKKEEVIGRRLRVNSSVGTILSTINTEKEKEVRYGEMIKVVWERGALQLESKMQALESGILGSWIRVQNPSNKKYLMVQVTGNSEAKLR